MVIKTNPGAGLPPVHFESGRENCRRDHNCEFFFHDLDTVFRFKLRSQVKIRGDDGPVRQKPLRWQLPGTFLHRESERVVILEQTGLGVHCFVAFKT